MVSLNTLNSWNSSSRTDKIVYIYWSNIGLAAAVDSKFDWEKLWNNWQQFPWTKKAVSRTAALLFDNNNACILKQNTNTARLCRFMFKGFKSGSGTTRPSGWIGPLIREYFYMTQIFSYGTQWANGFVCCPGGGAPISKGRGCLSGNFKWTPKRYQSGCGLSRILPLKGTNQKHRDKQFVSVNLTCLIAIKIKTYIRRCLNEMPFNWPWHP